jgi:hypothetical protein
MNTVICLPKFGITTRDPYVSIEVAWVAYQEPTPSQVSFNHFLTSLALASFLAEAKQTFTDVSTMPHNLGSSRATPSHLGGFTSKSNKCHEYFFTKLKCTSAHKEYLTQP